MKCKHRDSKIVHNGVSRKICRKAMLTTTVEFHKYLAIFLIIMGMGFIDSSIARPVFYQGMPPLLQMTENQQISRLPVFLLANEVSVPEVTDNTEIEAGTTWSYTEHITDGEETFDVKTYFVFISPTDVIWLFGTPKGDMFPVGFGTYNPSTRNLTFTASDKLHKKISLYYGDNTIIFKFDPSSGEARLYINDDYLSKFYNNGKNFYMTKTDYTLMPKNDLVGTFWKLEDDDETYIVYFKSWNEAVIHGESEESYAYVYIDDMVSIKTGDNLSDENAIGRYRGGNEMSLCREGIDPHGDVWCGTLRKVK